MWCLVSFGSADPKSLLSAQCAVSAEHWRFGAIWRLGAISVRTVLCFKNSPPGWTDNSRCMHMAVIPHVSRLAFSCQMYYYYE